VIIRVFRMRVKPGMHREYEALIREQVVPLMRGAPGLISLHVGAPLDDPPEEFLLMSIWRDLRSMQAFVGRRWREAFVLPGEEHLVAESIVDHYESLDDLAGVAPAGAVGAAAEPPTG
jgi:heme-degrading monooxygenase HmoA